MSQHDAMVWEPAEAGGVRCNLCRHRCAIAQGKLGVCRVRQNVGGELKTLNYDAIVAMNVDPIEKKPLFHFLPGSRSLSIAAPGCNFQCAFCQNWQISQMPREGRLQGEPIAPQAIVAAAGEHECQSISYTYTEPTIYFELAYDCCKLARQAGLKNVFVSNGYLTDEAIKTIAPYLDAINVDLKAFSDETYRRVMKAHLGPVLECLESLAAAGIWVEVTTLIVPGMNDSPRELEDLARFIATKLGRHVPWHVSRFHGDYEMTAVPATPLATLELACRLGREAGLKYVYCGNAPGQADERTRCPACSTVLIDRVGFDVRGNTLVKGACPACGEKIEGIWS